MMTLMMMIMMMMIMMMMIIIETQIDAQTVSNLVFYAQSTITVISGRLQTDKDTKEQYYYYYCR